MNVSSIAKFPPKLSGTQNRYIVNGTNGGRAQSISKGEFENILWAMGDDKRAHGWHGIVTYHYEGARAIAFIPDFDEREYSDMDAVEDDAANRGGY